MSSDLHLSIEPDASAGDVAAIDDALNEHNMRLTGIRDWRPLRIFVRDDAGRLRGGITGGSWGDWLHVVNLWVDEELRGAGWGSRLLAAAEADALAAGVHHAFLETHSFQARPFYERRGYAVVGTIEGYPPGGAYHLLVKHLA